MTMTEHSRHAHLYLVVFVGFQMVTSPEPDPARRPVHHQPVGVVEVPRADVPPPPQLQGDPQRVGPLVLVGPVGVGRNALRVAKLML